jgi:hypothetical protein
MHSSESVIQLMLNEQCFSYIICCEPSSTSSVERGEQRITRERFLWVKGIDRQLWDPTSRDHTPASRGFHGNMPEMRDFGEST